MRNISAWAKQHKNKARLSIIFLKILLAFMACYVAKALHEIKIILPGIMAFSALCLFIVAALIYPSGKKSTLSGKFFYLKQKSCDYILVASGFFMMVFFVNTRFYTLTNQPVVFANTPAAFKTNPPTAEEILKSLEHRDKKSLTRQEKRILKHEFKKQLKVYVKSKISGKKAEGDQAFLIILTIIAALGVMYLVAALSCSLACNGSDGAAIAVAILGAAGVIWATIAIINRITRGPKKKLSNTPAQ